MSDNRNYAVGVQNQGGAPVYMEDLKLSERSPAPNAASIANLKFLLTTGDDEGFRTAIKSYIDEAIRSALGALVDNLDKGTGVSRILGTDSNHDLGTITLANLSSVLGGIITHFELVESGELFNEENPHNYPARYGTCIKFRAYYTIYLLADHNAQHLWMGTDGNIWTQVK